MDKLLKPDRFDADPSVGTASKQWLHWFRTFENFLKAIGPDGPSKLNLLINYIVPSVYEFISECTSYDAAIETLRSMYVKPKNEIFARHLLATRKQDAGETLDSYLQTLKQLSKDCAFKSVSAEQCKEEAIRDAFIGGLYSNYIRQRLLENHTLNLVAAFDQARALEMAQSQADSYSKSPISVNAVTLDSKEEVGYNNVGTVASTSGVSGTTKCFFCGNKRHLRINCPARNVICNTCNKKGHYAKVCKSVSHAGTVASAVLATVSAASSVCLARAILKVKVNGIKAEALVDTGSSESFIDNRFRTKLKLKLRPTTGRVCMASTSLHTAILGHSIISLDLGDHNCTEVQVAVLQDLCADLILGHDILGKYSKIKFDFGGPKPPLIVGSLAPMVFSPPSLFANLTPDCRPIAIKSRRHTSGDAQFIKAEVARLLEEGIIEMSNSPWRAQVLVISGEHHKKRMVIDYSRTINRYTLLDAYPLPLMEDIVNRVAKYIWFSSLDLQSAYHQVAMREEEKAFTAFEADGDLYQFCRIPFGLTNGVASFQRVMDRIIAEAELKDTFVYVDNVVVCGNNLEEHNLNLQRFLETTKKYGLTLNSEKCEYAVKEVRLLGYLVKEHRIQPDPERLRPFLELEPPGDPKSLRRVIGMFAYYARWVEGFSEKIHSLVCCKSFPMPRKTREVFEGLKQEIAGSFVMAIDEKVPFVVETDASEYGIAATLSQAGKPVAFFTRTLSKGEQKQSAVEKEACAIVESLRKWRHYLLGNSFQLLTDQKSVSYMFDTKLAGKIKNEKIMRWRLELSCFSYEIAYRPGKTNVVPDAFSRICGATMNGEYLRSLHQALCHPGITRMSHFVRSRNLPFSVEEIRRMIQGCPECAELKPRFHRMETGHLIKATAPFERLSLDFKGPLPSVTSNKYLLTIVDEYSRFPFAFPCRDVSARSVIECLVQLFSVFGMPSYVHSDRGSAFMSKELKSFLHARGVVTSRTTAYNPQGNGQVERYNGIIWKSMQLGMRTLGLGIEKWETVLPEALHSIRSLLCTATNATPHERMFIHPRKSTCGVSMPSWLTSPGTVYMKKHERGSKYESGVEEVQLLEANPGYAHVRLSDGRETTVSVHHLAPGAELGTPSTEEKGSPKENEGKGAEEESREGIEPLQGEEKTVEDVSVGRRPERARQPPQYLKDYVRF